MYLLIIIKMSFNYINDFKREAKKKRKKKQVKRQKLYKYTICDLRLKMLVHLLKSISKSSLFMFGFIQEKCRITGGQANVIRKINGNSTWNAIVANMIHRWGK